MHQNNRHSVQHTSFLFYKKNQWMYASFTSCWWIWTQCRNQKSEIIHLSLSLWAVHYEIHSLHEDFEKPLHCTWIESWMICFIIRAINWNFIRTQHFKCVSFRIFVIIQSIVFWFFAIYLFIYYSIGTRTSFFKIVTWNSRPCFSRQWSFIRG